MAVFICWSGDRSKAIARALRTLLECVLPSLVDRSGELPASRVFLSDDIEKGVEWFQSVRARLDTARAGIVVLTHENTSNDWIHFEAGALAKKFEAESRPEEHPVPEPMHSGVGELDLAGLTRVATGSDISNTSAGSSAEANQQRLFPLLHGVTAAQLGGPLAAYQATATTRSDMDRLVSALATALGKPRPAADSEGFLIPEEQWNDFETALTNAVLPLAKAVPNLRSLFQRKTFVEPFQQCVGQDWLERYEDATVTLDRLRQHAALVSAACAPYEQGLFEMLLSDLDVYATAIRGLLVTTKEFRLGREGELEMDSGTQISCEDRRLAIK